MTITIVIILLEQTVYYVIIRKSRKNLNPSQNIETPPEKLSTGPPEKFPTTPEKNSTRLPKKFPTPPEKILPLPIKFNLSRNNIITPPP